MKYLYEERYPLISTDRTKNEVVTTSEVNMCLNILLIKNRFFIINQPSGFRDGA